MPETLVAQNDCTVRRHPPYTTFKILWSTHLLYITTINIFLSRSHQRAVTDENHTVIWQPLQPHQFLQIRRRPLPCNRCLCLTPTRLLVLLPPTCSAKTWQTGVGTAILHLHCSQGSSLHPLQNNVKTHTSIAHVSIKLACARHPFLLKRSG